MAEPEWVVTEDEAGGRLDKYLAGASRLGSRARALAALERGKVFLNDREAGPADAARRLVAGDRVRVWMDRPGSAKARPAGPRTSGELAIVHEDAALIVVNKPAGMLSVPLERKSDALSVMDLVERYLRPSGKRRPHIVHRIDQDTSGLVVFAKD